MSVLLGSRGGLVCCEHCRSCLCPSLGVAAACVRSTGGRRAKKEIRSQEQPVGVQTPVAYAAGTPQSVRVPRILYRAIRVCRGGWCAHRSLQSCEGIPRSPPLHTNQRLLYFVFMYKSIRK